MTEKYEQIRETESDRWSPWFRPIHNKPGRVHRDQCCNCSLVHDMQFSVDNQGRVIYRARRNKRATAAARRRHK